MPKPLSACLAAPLLAATLLVTAAGCNRRPVNASPDGAVRELVERLRLVNGDPAAAKSAFELLSKRARTNLAERAQRYSAASGKTIAPEAMIVPSRFVVRFEPQRYAAQISGNHALVEIIGLGPGDRAQVACVFEDEAWRVDLPFPPLPPVQVRPGNN
ncbi:hypothetical protein [Polyangium sorediatum]|uniref:Lipoprotein n=1 Tax=Polyangium sorediatum TaxID=889274 RepID=A0ABT6NTR2_9BACT|nr:hypothetical protein [Polyangium sorediatum]MDI1431525.1 hypothetical protein [Polyangium sorediatum]